MNWDILPLVVIPLALFIAARWLDQNHNNNDNDKEEKGQ